MLSLNFESETEVHQAKDYLTSRPNDEAVTLTLSGLGWRLSEALTCSAAQARIDQAVHLAGVSSVVVPFSRFSKTDQPLIKGQGQHWLKFGTSKPKDPLSRIFSYWEKTEGLLDPYFLAELQLEGLLARTAMFAWEESRNQLLFRHVGFRFEPCLGEEWGVHLRGSSLYCCEPPDRDYVHWLADQVNACFVAQTPNRALIDAVIRSPYSSELANRINDDRLLLPCRYPNGKAALVMISQRAPGAVPLI
ncbi:hypothetical protein ACTL6U_11190 [Rhodovibrionaceae bacterium A322]